MVVARRLVVVGGSDVVVAGSRGSSSSLTNRAAAAAAEDNALWSLRILGADDHPQVSVKPADDSIIWFNHHIIITFITSRLSVCLVIPTPAVVTYPFTCVMLPQLPAILP